MNEDTKIKLAHMTEMLEAVSETNIKNAHLAGAYMAKVSPGSKAFDRDRSDIEKSPLYSHFKTSWLLDPEVFKETLDKKELTTCKHLDPMNPGPMFSLLGSPRKAIFCIPCASQLAEILVQEFPDRCDLCTTAPHTVFHEIMLTAGAVNITGNICGDCSETYMTTS